MPDESPDDATRDGRELVRTSDLALAAFLVISRNLADVGSVGRRIVFSFARDDRIQTDINEFLSMRGSVAPARYWQAVKGLKAILYETQRNGKTSEASQTATADDRAYDLPVQPSAGIAASRPTASVANSGESVPPVAKRDAGVTRRRRT